MVLHLYQLFLAHTQIPVSLLLAEHAGLYMLGIYSFHGSN